VEKAMASPDDLAGTRPDDLLSKSFELPPETPTEFVGGTWIVINSRHDWRLAWLLPPFLIVAVCAGILVGRITRPDRTDFRSSARMPPLSNPPLATRPAIVVTNEPKATVKTLAPKAVERKLTTAGKLGDRTTTVHAPDPSKSPVQIERTAHKVERGLWRIERDELVQSSLERGTMLVFGEPTWAYYDLTFQAKSTTGSHGFKVFFSFTEPRSFRAFAVGNYFNRATDLAFEFEGRWGRHLEMVQPGSIEMNRWYDVLIQVRGTEAACFVDGELIFEEDDSRFPRGCVAFSTWEAVVHFRNVKVSTPVGAVLWEGLPQPPKHGNPINVPQRVRADPRDTPREEFHRLARVQREQLQRQIEKAADKPLVIPAGQAIDPLEPGSVWKGERSYRRGGYAGKTVAYELHIRDRDGRQFTGHKFDNGPGRNRVEVEGFVDNDTISWIEPSPISLMTMRGTIRDNVIEVTFDGIYINGTANVGDGKLTRH
jgi:hypothetical protein